MCSILLAASAAAEYCSRPCRTRRPRSHGAEAVEPIDFQRRPENYLHWKLSIDGPVARLVLDVQEEKPWREGYPLKLNSYDLGVDLELADAVERLRFEQPQVRVLVITSSRDKIFSAGANIYMLQSSSHPFKVN